MPHPHAVCGPPGWHYRHGPPCSPRAQKLTAQITRAVGPAMNHYWANIVDVSPILIRHWENEPSFQQTAALTSVDLARTLCITTCWTLPRLLCQAVEKCGQPYNFSPTYQVFCARRLVFPWDENWWLSLFKYRSTWLRASTKRSEDVNYISMASFHTGEWGTLIDDSKMVC